MKKVFLIVSIIMIVSGISTAQLDQNYAKALSLNALKNRKDIVAGAGTAFINIQGFNLNNSSGPSPVNYNYFIGTSSYTALENFPKYYTILAFTAGKIHASMPGAPGNELTLFNASSLDGYYLTAKTSIGRRLITNKAFYLGIETGPYFDLLGYIEINGNGMKDETYFHDNFKGFNWGWTGGITVGFRSFFANWSIGKNFKDYSQIENTSMTIPFHTRFSVGARFSSKYGEKDAEKLNKLKKGKLK
jgi:hypothetical protein